MNKTYNSLQYTYKCSICDTTNFKSVIEECEECEFGYTVDDSGNYHNHDLNGGDTKLVCENNHETTYVYVASCECGWNSIEGDKVSCETFVNSKQVFISDALFGSDDDNW